MKFEILFILILGFSFTCIAVPLVNYFGLKFSIVDKPDSRKQHDKPIVRIGGLAIIIGVLFTNLICTKFGLINQESILKIDYVLAISSMLFILGFVDDFVTLTFSKRLFFQFLISIFAFSENIRFLKIDLNWLIPNIQIIELPYFLSLIITLIWIVGIINAFNWLDGLDGLASGLAAITCLGLGFASFGFNPDDNFLLIFMLCGSCLGFLYHNFNPAKIFMGDGGSYFIGSFIGLYSINLYNLNFSDKNFSINLFALFLILFVPIVDMVYVVFSRVLKGKLPFLPDRRHLHHRLLRSGFDHRDSVVFCYLMSFFLLQYL